MASSPLISSGPFAQSSSRPPSWTFEQTPNPVANGSPASSTTPLSRTDKRWSGVNATPTSDGSFRNHGRKVIDVPCYKIMEKNVEVERHHEVLKTVPVRKVVEVEKQVVQQIPVWETKMIEKEVDVMGDVIEVPKPFLIENRVVVPRFTDKKVPMVVAQTLQPRFTESSDHFVEIKLKEYEPEVVTVDVFLPRPVERTTAILGDITRTNMPVKIPLAQYNALIYELNAYRETEDSHIPYTFVSESETAQQQQVQEDDETASTTAAASSESTEIRIAEWLDQMFIPTAVGAVPIGLCTPQRETEARRPLVQPVSDQWMEYYKEHSEYIATTADPPLTEAPTPTSGRSISINTHSQSHSSQ